MVRRNRTDAEGEQKLCYKYWRDVFGASGSFIANGRLKARPNASLKRKGGAKPLLSDLSSLLAQDRGIFNGTCTEIAQQRKDRRRS